MWKLIRAELKKQLSSPAFIGSILLVTVLCFSANVYTDYITGKVYTVFEAMLYLPESLKQELISLSSIEVFASGLTGSYATLFVPMAVGFGYVPLRCSEWKSGQVRTQLIRTNKTKYCIGVYLTAMITGGCTLLFGYLIYGALVFLGFPAYDVATAELQGLQLPSAPALYVFKMCLGKFLYGMTAVWPSFLLCTFCRQTHLILCLPVLFCFLQNSVLDLLTLKNHELAMTLLFTTPPRVALLLHLFSWEGLLLSLCGPLVSFIVFYVCLHRRTDCGT